MPSTTEHRDLGSTMPSGQQEQQQVMNASLAAVASADEKGEPNDDDDTKAANGNENDDVVVDLWSQYDASRMQLTEEELEWAINIKNAIESIPDLDVPSDLWCAQLAIVTRGNIEDAVNRAYRMQDHRKENNIMDTLDDGLRNMPKEISFLSFDYNLHTGGYIVAYDVAVFDAIAFQYPDNAKNYQRRCFYCNQMAFCDLAALRAGLTVLIECEGHANVKGKSMDLNAFRCIWQGVHNYPRNLTQVKFFNSPMLFNCMVSMAKSTLPKELTSKFNMGAKFPPGRLDKFYHLPTPEIARERLQKRMREALQRRYANEEYFSLEEQQKQQQELP